MSDSTIAAFPFMQATYTDLDDLVNDMAAHWEEGKALLFSGKLREHVRKSHPSLANACSAVEKEYAQQPEEADHLFLQWLCKYPGIRGLYYQGKAYGGLPDLAAVLSGKVTAKTASYSTKAAPDTKSASSATKAAPDVKSASSKAELQKLLHHLLLTQLLCTLLKNLGAKQELLDNVRFLEKECAKTNTKFAPENAIPMLEVFLNDRKTLLFDGQTFQSPAELARYLQEFADISKSALSRKIQPLFQNNDNFAPSFEAFILMHGFAHELTLWKGRFQEITTKPYDSSDTPPTEEAFPDDYIQS